MATDKADRKKKEQERIKKQLAVLGVVLVLLLYAQRDKILGKGAGATTGTQLARSAGQLTPGGPSSGLAPSAGASSAIGGESSGGGSAANAQTPFDIPTLTSEVVEKLKARKERRPLAPDEVPRSILDKTINPFTTFDVDRDQYASAEAPAKSASSGSPGPVRSSAPTVKGEVPRTLTGYRSFGVMVLDGEKQAIIKKEGRVVPYHLRDGDRLEGAEDNFRVNITGDNRVLVQDTEATRSDEKYFELVVGGPPRIMEAAPLLSAPSKPASTAPALPSGSEPPVVFLDESF